jgi:hypothetical protein
LPFDEGPSLSAAGLAACGGGGGGLGADFVEGVQLPPPLIAPIELMLSDPCKRKRIGQRFAACEPDNRPARSDHGSERLTGR